ncbi:hypothetical protein KSX_23460 [Ktedonospora formicarum]|uniref:Peptidoglycan binding-like domain-containing protein n=1 Tax=Ktedonospora formicarum TaxID=2778364 RepID=A0A8J3I039_9CHLR|nr:hypothetical protein KSX_23460 [Ktedonospora formicarum]
MLLLLALIGVNLFTGGTAHATSITTATWPVYTPGSSGKNVRAIQYLLKDQGYSLDLTSTYDQATGIALKNFQAKNNLRTDGIVGALTWPKLIKAGKLRDQGYAIMALQYLLNRAGFTLNDDGIFSPETEKVVRKYQQHTGLNTDGVAGIRTWMSLLTTTATQEKSNHIGQFRTSTTTSKPSHPSTTNKASSSSLHGLYGLDQKPTINATFINRVLAYYHSPAQGLGQTIYDNGVKYGIDPAFALAFFGHESSFGLYGIAVETHSLGNIRCTAGYICLATEGNGSFRKYGSWSEGIEDWYRLIRELYLDQNHLYTITQIVPVYAPQADHNNEHVYIEYIEEHIQIWRDDQIYA